MVAAMSALAFDTDDPQERERIARECMDRCLDLVEPIFNTRGRFNGGGEWGAGEYRFPCPVHGKDDPTSDGLRVSIQRNAWWEPRWWCPKCESAGSGYLDLLAALVDQGVPYEALPNIAQSLGRPQRAKPPTTTRRPRRHLSRVSAPVPTEDDVARWASVLRRDAGARRFLVETRMWAPDCIELLQIGLDWREYRPRPSITIPVRDGDGELVNVRLWDPRGPKGQRWQWLVRGVENPRLWPLSRLATERKGDRVYLCAGEPDAMVAMSLGHTAVTSLYGEGKGGELRPEDLALFAGKRVVVVYDSDATGRAGAKAAVQALRDYGGCRTVHSRDLWKHQADPTHKDLTDWIRAGNAMPMPLNKTRKSTTHEGTIRS